MSLFYACVVVGAGWSLKLCSCVGWSLKLWELTASNCNVDSGCHSCRAAVMHPNDSNCKVDCGVARLLVMVVVLQSL